MKIIVLLNSGNSKELTFAILMTVFVITHCLYELTFLSTLNMQLS